MMIYTKTGDHGETSLYSGQRVLKASLRVDAYGTIDEVSAFLGLARSLSTNERLCQDIYEVQRLLIAVMTELATLNGDALISAADIELIEQKIDWYTERVDIGRSFDIPGSSQASSALHIARTVTRRAERLVCQLASDDDEGVRNEINLFLNRLSDLCFVLSLYETQR
ncbi:MAG: cob(I)yrinic acid a,c-diamide adenosyltransferase [Coriobacteriales bacterium]|jgi:cob(I)alamin adenosyltransferase|nr:cob(I)yrinic acid a,c-diamide adenosyltransferase [Coriobacteriales bacterium]